MKLYADGTDWAFEFSRIGAAFYLTPEACEKAHPCIDECGVVEVEVTGEMPAVEDGKCFIPPSDECEDDGCQVNFVRWVREPEAGYLRDSEGQPARYREDRVQDGMVILRPGDEGFDEAEAGLFEEI